MGIEMTHSSSGQPVEKVGHLMLERRNPVVSYLRACQQNHKVLSHAEPVSIGYLRKAGFHTGFGVGREYNGSRMIVAAKARSCKCEHACLLGYGGMPPPPSGKF